MRSAHHKEFVIFVTVRRQYDVAQVRIHEPTVVVDGKARLGKMVFDYETVPKGAVGRARKTVDVHIQDKRSA